MYNTIKVMILKITNAEIKFFRKSGFYSVSIENIKHIKILPFLSIVQSVEGSYDIALGSGDMQKTEEGGFFIAPSGVQQTIVHHVNQKSGKMSCRWIFIDVEINRAYKLDSLYRFPTVIKGENKGELGELFDRLFKSDSIWENYSCCYKVLEVLLKTAELMPQKVSLGIESAVAHMTQNFAKPMSIAELAKIANMSESNFYPAFKKQFACSPISYLNHYRLSVAAERLSETNDPISDISYLVGINDPLYFSKLFKKIYGMTPGEYRLMRKK